MPEKDFEAALAGRERPGTEATPAAGPARDQMQALRPEMIELGTNAKAA